MSLNFLRKKKIVIPALVLVVAISSFFILKHSMGIVGVPFGGKVISSVPCVCSGSFLLTVSPPAGGQFVYFPGTQAYLNYNLGAESGMWALGLYTPGGVCLIPSGKGCAPLGVPIGTISPTVGSSLIF